MVTEKSLYGKASSSLKSRGILLLTGSSKGRGLGSSTVIQNLYFLLQMMGSIPLLLFTLSTTFILPGIICKPRSTKELNRH